MDIDAESIVKVIFPEGVPDSWLDNPDFTGYLSKLSAYNLEKLCKEPSHCELEKSSVLAQTQELAFAHYKTFIKTAECSRELFKQFEKAEERLDSLTTRLPEFSGACGSLLTRGTELGAARARANTALGKHSQLLSLLELPQLLEAALRGGLLEESLSLIHFGRRLSASHPELPILQRLGSECEKCWLVLRGRLLAELRGELGLPRCLTDLGVLRRMGALSETELRLVFLQARSHHLNSLLTSSNHADSSKRLEIYRSQLFNIITQYRGVFPPADDSPHLKSKHRLSLPSLLLQEWINYQVNEVVSVGEGDWGSSEESGNLESRMYLGQSLGRVGCDLRGLLSASYLRAVLARLEDSLTSALGQLGGDLERGALITVQEELTGCQIEFYPLARLTNSFLSCFNSLRHTAPLSLAAPLSALLEGTLTAAAHQIAAFHSREQTALLGSGEVEQYYRLVRCFSDRLLPYIQSCLQTLFPPQLIASFLGLSLLKLQAQGLTYLSREKMIEPIKHLLPPPPPLVPLETVTAGSQSEQLVTS